MADQFNNSAVPNILDAYEAGIGNIFDTLDARHADKSTAQVMVGYLSAASIALRCIANVYWADRFSQVSTRLNNDWTCFDEELRKLQQELYSRKKASNS